MTGTAGSEVRHTPSATPLAMMLLILLFLAPLTALLSITVTAETPTGSESEPNNDKAGANDLVTGDRLVAHLDRLSDDVDWYRIWVPRGHVVNVTVMMHDEWALNADLEMFYEDRDGTGQKAWSLTDYRYETVSVLGIMDQYHYIKVTAFSGSGAYEIDARAAPPSIVQDGAVVQGSLFNDSYNVIDFYRIWLEARADGSADSLQVHMDKWSASPGAEPDLTLRILRLEEWEPGLSLYDLSWAHEDAEDASATATTSGWYYIRVYAIDGAGHYRLTVSVADVKTDGDGDPSDPTQVYGRDILMAGSVSQAGDHVDSYGLYLVEGETLAIQARLWFSTATLFGITLVGPDGAALGTWTNLETTGGGWPMLVSDIGIDAGPAPSGGLFTIVLTAREAVQRDDPTLISQQDGSLSYELTISPGGHNTAPAVSPGHASRLFMEEDTPYVLELAPLFTDPDIPDGDALFYGVGGTGMSIVLGLDDMKATITPQKDMCGEDTILVTARDLFGERAEASLGLVVSCTNDPPVHAGDAVIELDMDEDQVLEGPGLDDLFTDPDLPFDGLSYDIVGSPDLPATVSQDGTLVLGPATGHPGDHYLTVTARDNHGAGASCIILVHVAHVPHAPTASDAERDVMIPEDGSVLLSLGSIFADIEDPALSYTWTGNAEVRPVLRGSGLLELSGPQDWHGSEDIQVRATDSEGLSATVMLHVHVTSVPDAPTITAMNPEDQVVELDGGQATFWVEISDPDGAEDVLEHVWFLDGGLVAGGVAGPASGTYVLDGGELAPGDHPLRLMVTDRTGNQLVVEWMVRVPEASEGPEPVMTSDEGAVVATGASLMIWGLAIAGLSEYGRYGLLKALFLPLYSKIKKENVLDHFTRGRIFGFVESHPGCNYSQIKDHVGVGNGTLTHHLATLEREGYIRSERDGLLKRFYPAQANVEGDVIELSKVQKEIYAVVKLEPGISQADVAKTIGISRRVVNYHVRLLGSARLLRLERGAKKTYLHVVEPDEGQDAVDIEGREEAVEGGDAPVRKRVRRRRRLGADTAGREGPGERGA